MIFAQIQPIDGFVLTVLIINYHRHFNMLNSNLGVGGAGHHFSCPNKSIQWRPNYFFFIGYLKPRGGKGVQANPLSPSGSATGVPSRVSGYSFQLCNKWLIKTKVGIIFNNCSFFPWYIYLYAPKFQISVFNRNHSWKIIYRVCLLSYLKAYLCLVHLHFCMARH